MGVPRLSVPLDVRFWAKVSIGAPSECWQWTGALKGNGYGMIAAPMMHKGGFPLQAHRVAYELHYGPIPDGLTVHHLCFNRACVNPAHLKLLTRSENSGICQEPRAPRLPRPARTHCKHGHSLADAVLDGGYRRCRTCKREHERARYRNRSRSS